MTATSGHDSETSSPRSRRGSVYPARQSSCPVLSGSCVTVAQNYTRKTQTRDRYRGGLKRVCSVQQPSHQGKEEEEEEEEGENIVAAVADDQAAEGAAQSESLEASSSESAAAAAASMDRSYNTPGGGTEGKGAVQDASGAAKESLVQGVLEEVGLIQWPTITGALLNTALVIGIVFGTSLVLLAVNTGLAELSREIYSYKL